MQKNNKPNLKSLSDVSKEVVRAREKFPTNEHMLAALMEEVGELSNALLEQNPWEEIYGEAKQVAAVAIRIMEEGDSDFRDSPAKERADTLERM